MIEYITIAGIAVGLAMDAFTVSIATGIRLGCVSGAQAFRMSFSFGFFQFIMTVIGWALGTSVEKYIKTFDHWVAFSLLAVIGGKMIFEAMEKQGDTVVLSDPTKGVTLLGLSVATSIDALAVGLGFGVLHQGIVVSSVIIGLVAGGFSVLGIHLGCRISLRATHIMEALGGLLLIGIGLKILLEHTIFVM